MSRRIHDRELLDTIEELGSETFEGTVWRVCNDKRAPTRGAPVPGRWSDGSSEVLYTSMDAEVALEEVYYHVFRKNPVPPSQVTFLLNELKVKTEQTLQLLDTARLNNLGIEVNSYFSNDLKHAKTSIYPITQAISAAAEFLGYDGLIVPSARLEGSNLVLFLENILPENSPEVLNQEKVDWKAKGFR